MQAETLESGCRQDNGVILAGVELRQTGADVSAQRSNLSIRPQLGQLTLTAQS